MEFFSVYEPFGIGCRVHIIAEVNYVAGICSRDQPRFVSHN